MTTLKEIAARTGFSISVVSRALNLKPDAATRISKETRQKILKTAESMGYTRNRFAEFLKRGKHPVIGVFIPEWANRLMADLVYGLAEAANAFEFPLRLSLGMNYEQYRDFLNDSHKNPKCGLITYPYFETDNRITKLVESFRAQGNQMVLMHSTVSVKGVPVVTMDDEEGGRIAARHLLEKGCKQFVVFGMFDSRSKGFKEVLAGKKIKPIEFSNDAMFYPKLLTLQKKASINNPLGIFAVTDIIALSVMRAFKEKPGVLGREVKLIGYDDLDFAAHLTPALTTLHQPFKKIGSLAVEKLVSLMEGQEANSEIIKPWLVVRESA